jgi:uncharacterized membrane protein YgaE (UPF0421/DUF939 family)
MLKEVFFIFIILIVTMGCNHGTAPVTSVTGSIFIANVGTETWMGKSYLDFGPKGVKIE